MEVRALQEELDHAHRDTDELRAQIQSLSAENRRLRRRDPEPPAAEGPQEGSSSSTAPAHNLAAHVRTFQARLDLGKASMTNDELHDENTTLREEIVTLKDELQASKKEVTALHKEVEESRRKSLAPVQQLAQASARLQRAEEECERQRHEFQLARQASQCQIKALEDRLESSLAQHSSAQLGCLGDELGCLEADEDEDGQRTGEGDASFDPCRMARLSREKALQVELLRARSDEAFQPLRRQVEQEHEQWCARRQALEQQLERTAGAERELERLRAAGAESPRAAMAPGESSKKVAFKDHGDPLAASGHGAPPLGQGLSSHDAATRTKAVSRRSLACNVAAMKKSGWSRRGRADDTAAGARPEVVKKIKKTHTFKDRQLGSFLAHAAQKQNDQDELEEMEARIDELEDLVRQQEDDRVEAQGQALKHLAQATKNRAEAAVNHRRLEELEEQRAAFHAELQSAKEVGVELQAAREESAVNHRRLEELEEQRAAFHAELQSAKEVGAELRAARGELRAASLQEAGELQEAREKLQELRACNDEMRARSEELQATREEDMRTRIEELRASEQGLQAAREELQAVPAQEVRKLRAAREELQELRACNEELRARRQSPDQAELRRQAGNREALLRDELASEARAQMEDAQRKICKEQRRQVELATAEQPRVSASSTLLRERLAIRPEARASASSVSSAPGEDNEAWLLRCQLAGALQMKSEVWAYCQKKVGRLLEQEARLQEQQERSCRLEEGRVPGERQEVPELRARQRAGLAGANERRLRAEGLPPAAAGLPMAAANVQVTGVGLSPDGIPDPLQQESLPGAPARPAETGERCQEVAQRAAVTPSRSPCSRCRVCGRTAHRRGASPTRGPRGVCAMPRGASPGGASPTRELRQAGMLAVQPARGQRSPLGARADAFRDWRSTGSMPGQQIGPSIGGRLATGPSTTSPREPAGGRALPGADLPRPLGEAAHDPGTPPPPPPGSGASDRETKAELQWRISMQSRILDSMLGPEDASTVMMAERLVSHSRLSCSRADH